MGEKEKELTTEEQKDERFTVHLSMSITEHDHEDRLRSSSGDHQFDSVDYGTMVGLELLMLGVLNKLGEAGIKAAVRKGLGHKLQALGFELPDKD